MPHLCRRVALSVPLLIGVLGAVPTSAQTPATSDEYREAKTSIIIETLAEDHEVDPAEAARLQAEADNKPPLDAAASAPSGRAFATGSIQLSFDSSVPSNVRSVVAAAAAQWDASLGMNQPVNVSVHWDCLGNPGLLAYAGPETSFSGAGLGETWYPVALANQLAGTDLNGSSPEVIVAINAELGASGNGCTYATDSWYISTNTSVGSRIDLYSVVLHELAHGLGFLGSAYVRPGESSPVVGDPDASGARSYYHYDRLVEAGTTSLVALPDPDAQLTSNNLFITLGGGHRQRIFAPSTFRTGSSFSHFDDSAVGGPGELMSPALSHGAVHRVIDAPVLGVLAQQGWTVIPKAVTPTNITTSGDATATRVTWNHNLTALGLPPTSYTVTATASGSPTRTVTVAGTATTATLTDLLPGVTYQLDVVPSATNGTGTAGRISFTTSAIPTAPKLVRSDGVGQQRRVGWQAAEAPSEGGTVTYQVQARRINTSSWQDVGSTTATSIDTPKLAEDIYQFRVRGQNQDGSGPWSLSTLIGVSDSSVRPMPLDGQVGRLYEAYLLRSPDTNGFAYWLNERASGRSLAEISGSFESSPEFTDRYGALSNSSFVNRVYQNVVDREPDADGARFWLNYLNTGHSRGSMMIGFSESPEFIDKTETVGPSLTNEGKIWRLYVAFFKREPDANGLAYWTGRYAAGASLQTIAEGFVDSDEFQERYGGLDNAAFIELVYRNVLIRTPDASGLSYWTRQMNSGLSQGAVMVGFSESAEFIIRTGTLP